jgi:hypothetical protein
LEEMAEIEERRRTINERLKELHEKERPDNKPVSTSLVEDVDYAEETKVSMYIRGMERV